MKPKIRMGDVRDSERLAHVLRAELRRGDAAECGMVEERRCGHRLLGRPVSESGRLRHGDGGPEEATAAGGCPATSTSAAR